MACVLAASLVYNPLYPCFVAYAEDLVQTEDVTEPASEPVQLDDATDEQGLEETVPTSEDVVADQPDDVVSETPVDATAPETEEPAPVLDESESVVTEDEEPSSDEETLPLDHEVTLTWENDSYEVKAQISSGSLFSHFDEVVNADAVHLLVKEDTGEAFDDLGDAEPDKELATVNVLLCAEDGTELEQLAGTTDVTVQMSLPDDQPDACLSDVEVYQYKEEAPRPEEAVEQLEKDDVDVADSRRDLVFEGDHLGAYAISYTVDFYYEGMEYHMPGGARMLLSELFDRLGVDLQASDVTNIEFTNPDVLTLERYEDGSDWVIESTAPFRTWETMTITFSDGYKLPLSVTDDDGSYTLSSNLDDFLSYWKLTVGENEYTNDNVDESTVIEYKAGVQYSLELRFNETSGRGFDTPAENPPEMVFMLPDNFNVPDGFTMPLNVSLGRKGTLANNVITVESATDEGGNRHSYLRVRWNWEDTLHWNYFRDSAQAKLTVKLNGTLGGREPQTLVIGEKTISIRRQDLHNAKVTKEGSYDPMTSTITYRVGVSSDGTTSDITLTDTLGSALVYNGDIAYVPGDSTNTAGTEPQITPKTGNTFNVVIPQMNDGDVLYFTYTASVNPEAIAQSGNPTFEETGNTAQIFGDSYTQDNTAMYHEMGIEFSDLVKNALGTHKQNIDGSKCYVVDWEIDTNSRAQYPLADTDVTDTIGEDVQDICRYYGDGITVKCYTVDGALADTRTLAWEELGVDVMEDMTWTYHIPDTDPQYHYVITYATLVNMEAQTKERLIYNLASGKGGEDVDRLPLSPTGGDIGVSKRVIDEKSNEVTWEIKLNLKDSAFDKNSLELWEYQGTNSSNPDDITLGMPYRWNLFEGKSTMFKESLKRLEVLGLQDGETFTLRYCGNKNNDDAIARGAVTPYYPEAGSTVIEGTFAHNPTWLQNTFALAFYKDENRTLGGLNAPSDGSDNRTLTIRITSSFSENWAVAARDNLLANARIEAYRFEHVNWIYVCSRNNDGTYTTITRNTDKIAPYPPHLYKACLGGQDTTTTAESYKKEYYLLRYPNYRKIMWNETKTGLDFPDDPVFPVFRFQAVVSGIKYDEPIVIEDTFDTSLFDLIQSNDIDGGQKAATLGGYKWGNAYFARFFGSVRYGWGPVTSAGTTDKYYMDGYKNKINGIEQPYAQDMGCTIEDTDTGVRFTIEHPFRTDNGGFYPFYGVEYWLVPKNLEALKQIEEMAAANALTAPGAEQKATFTNTATSRGTSATATIKIGVENNFMPIDKTSQSFVELAETGDLLELDKSVNGGETTYTTPAGVTANDISRYIMKYHIVLNNGKERLNDGNPIVVEDEYKDNLSVDFNSIRITTDPPEAADKVSYDFTGNVGSFVIPDETTVTLEYDATIIQSTQGMAEVSNTVRMLSYTKTVTDLVAYSGSNGSSALNPAILVKKYATGHMESGLDGAKFRLYKYNHDSYERGGSNTEADWTPVKLRDGGYAEFETGELTLNDKDYGHGMAEIELRQDSDGANLEYGKVYGLREIVTPTKLATNGDTITYKNPHSDSFYCYIFKIADPEAGEMADYNNYVYLSEDTMTVRNSPESITLHLKKQLAGNVTLSDAETSMLTYQVFKKREVEPGVYQYRPIMKPVDEGDGVQPGEAQEVVDPRYVGITYDQIATSSDGYDLTGLTLDDGAEVGEYLLAEYGNEQILAAHPDWSWTGTYDWEGGTIGTFSKIKHNVYDENGNPSQAYGVEFTVSSQEVRDGEDKSVSIQNSYVKETLTLNATKKWLAPNGSTSPWPTGSKVKFQLGTIDAQGTFTAVSGVSQVELDNVKDANGESTAGTATFKDLPKYRAVGEDKEEIVYAVRETSAPSDYVIVYPSIAHPYATFAGDGTATIKNQAPSTSISVSKDWQLAQGDAAGAATLRLYAYTGTDASAATWVSNVNDIVLDGTADVAVGEFGEDSAWHASFVGLPKYDSAGKELRYVVREIGCIPATYEPSYPAGQDYAAKNETITNRPASTTFEVSKQWRETRNNAWPAGTNIELTLHRRSASGVDDSFARVFELSSTAIVSASDATDATWSDSRLTVSGLPKYDGEGQTWTYYVVETPMEEAGFATTYKNKNGYNVAGSAPSGGMVVNTLSAKTLTLSKTVEGNMGDRTKSFAFEVALTLGGSPVTGSVPCEVYDGSTLVSADALRLDASGKGTVHLAHGQSATLSDLPAGYAYTVTEVEGNTGGYQTTCSVDGATAEVGASVSGTMTRDHTLEFTNRLDGQVVTGVRGGNMGIYACIATVAVGIALAALRRRRHWAKR